MRLVTDWAVVVLRAHGWATHQAGREPRMVSLFDVRPPVTSLPSVHRAYGRLTSRRPQGHGRALI